MLLAKVKQVTIASAICMIVYLSTYWVTSALMNDAPKQLYLLALSMYSLAFMIAFNLILIYITFIRNNSGEDDAVRDFKNGYWGLKTDIFHLFKRELSTLIAFAMINGVCWSMTSIDKLFFSRKTITGIFLVYAPLNIVGVVLPDWANSVLGYLLGTVFCFAVYLLELGIFRKKWYKKCHK